MSKEELIKIYLKWKESGLLDGLEYMTTSSMAEMMESEKKFKPKQKQVKEI